MTTEKPKEVVEGAKIDFTYSVQWTPTSTTFEHRFDKYLDDKFFEHQVRGYTPICLGCFANIIPNRSTGLVFSILS